VSDLAEAMAGLLSGDERQAEAAAACLPSLGAAALVRLTGLTSSSDPEARWWATRALSGFADPAAVMAVLTRLSDPDPAVRQCAAIGLRLQPSIASLPALTRALFDDDALVARLAADALAAAGPDAIPHLQSTLQSGSRRARLEAARALAGMRHNSAIPALYAALEDPSPLVQHWAEQGLEALGMGMVYFSPG
jgi:HEAT repeat protein